MSDWAIGFLPGLDAPSLYILARPVLAVEEIDRFLKEEDTSWRRTTGAPPADELVEFAGRICYYSFGDQQSRRTTDQYIANLIGRDHGSVLEHATWTFLLTGVTRAFTHQLVRHRVGFSYSQLSQQYHEESHARFVEPSPVAANPSVQAQWRASVVASFTTYRDTLAQLPAMSELDTMRREQLRRRRAAARSLLPNAVETKIVVTANARALRHFLTQRGGLEGDEEMRVVSARLLETLRHDAPSLFQDFKTERLTDGSPIVRAIRA